MPPPELHGLNIVDIQPPQQADNLDLAGTSFPDLDAQLELWTNLAFQSDEPLIPRPSSPTHIDSLDLTPVSHHTIQPEFDMSRFFAGFGVDPFIVPPPNTSLPISSTDPSLTTLNSSPSVSSSFILTTPPIMTDGPPPAKRSRVRKGSWTSAPSEESMSQASPKAEEGDPTDEQSPDDPHSNTTTPINSAEDKRRRNTAASARFRAKKKEREAALEKKSKELESRVGELERECEALKRENGWLKGLVVGVTNAGNKSTSQGTKRRRQEDTQTTDIPGAIKA